VFLVNSRPGRLSATSRCLLCETNHTAGHPLSRSYGVILPSSFTRVLSSALGFSPYLPVLVLVRTPVRFATRLFLETLQTASPPNGFSPAPGPCWCGFTYTGPQARQRTFSIVRQPSGFRPLFGQHLAGGAGILTCCPSPTPFGLGLGPPNPGRICLPQETSGFRRAGF
jgi:hypothetical protein